MKHVSYSLLLLLAATTLISPCHPSEPALSSNLLLAMSRSKSETDLRGVAASQQVEPATAKKFLGFLKSFLDTHCTSENSHDCKKLTHLRKVYETAIECGPMELATTLLPDIHVKGTGYTRGRAREGKLYEIGSYLPDQLLSPQQKTQLQLFSPSDESNNYHLYFRTCDHNGKAMLRHHVASDGYVTNLLFQKNMHTWLLCAASVGSILAAGTVGLALFGKAFPRSHRSAALQPAWTYLISNRATGACAGLTAFIGSVVGIWECNRKKDVVNTQLESWDRTSVCWKTDLFGHRVEFAALKNSLRIPLDTNFPRKGATTNDVHNPTYFAYHVGN